MCYVHEGFDLIYTTVGVRSASYTSSSLVKQRVQVDAIGHRESLARNDQVYTMLPLEHGTHDPALFFSFYNRALKYDPVH